MLNHSNQLKQKAISLGASEFGNSSAKNKRFYVIYNGKRLTSVLNLVRHSLTTMIETNKEHGRLGIVK